MTNRQLTFDAVRNVAPRLTTSWPARWSRSSNSSRRRPTTPWTGEQREEDKIIWRRSRCRRTRYRGRGQPRRELDVANRTTCTECHLLARSGNQGAPGLPNTCLRATSSPCKFDRTSARPTWVVMKHFIFFKSTRPVLVLGLRPDFVAFLSFVKIRFYPYSRTTRRRTTTGVITRSFGRWTQTKMARALTQIIE